MLRVLVFSENLTCAQRVHERTIEQIRDLGIKCEIALSDKIEVCTEPEAKLYDIYIIDARSIAASKLAAYIRNRTLIPSIVFFSSKGIHEAMLKYRTSAVITDPDNEEKFKRVLKWCCNEQIKAHPYFSVKNKDMQMKIDYDTISYFESRQRIVMLHTTKQVIEFYAKLSDVEALLPVDRFVRCHQSYIVNMSRIKELDKVNRCFKMISGITIDISKSCYATAVERYEGFSYG